MSLLKILGFAIMTGISFGLAYRAGSEYQAGVGFSVLNLFFQNIDPTLQALITMVSAVLTVFFIYRLARFFREIYEYRLFGVASSVLGFSGSMLVILAPQANSNVIVLGVALWIVGLIVVIYKKRMQKRY